MKKILVTRFSAMGDVAMTVPVIRNLLIENPDVEVIFVSRPFFSPFFQNIERLKFLPVDLEKEYKGIYGLYRLSKRLKKERFDAYVDLHNVLRTKILRFFLRFSINQTVVIDKGRKQRKQLTAKKNKVFRPLKKVTQRYADAFRALNICVTFNDIPYREKIPLPSSLKRKIWFDSSKKHLGIAPFAAYKGKVYPFERMQKVINRLAESSEIQIYLFGSGQDEQQQLQAMAKAKTNVVNIVGKTSLEEQLKLISHLNLMFSMDSANMHLASLENTPVVSFWGATHPYAGFMGYGQSEQNIIQRDLSCRPCSTYGNKPCWRRDWACLDVNEDQIVKNIKEILNIA